MKKFWTLAAAAACSLFIVAGCNSGSTDGGGGGGTAEGGKKFKVGVSIPAADHGWTAGVGWWAKEAAKLRREVEAHPLVRAVLEAFPGAVIGEIRRWDTAEPSAPEADMVYDDITDREDDA